MPKYFFENNEVSEDRVIAAAENLNLSVEEYLKKYNFTVEDDENTSVETPSVTTPPRTRETSWWRGEEGFIPDELQGIKRPDVTVEQPEVVKPSIDDDQSKISHATIDEVKEAGSDTFMRDDGFVDRMNEKYKKYGIEFSTAVVGGSAFRMHSSKTNKTSDAIFLAGALSKPWESITQTIQDFVNENSPQSSSFNKEAAKKWEERSIPYKQSLNQMLNSDDFLSSILGEDPKNWRWIQPVERGGKGGIGEENDYKLLSKALKQKISEKFADDENVSEHDIDLMVRDVVGTRFEKAKGLYIKQKNDEMSARMAEMDIDFGDIAKMTDAWQKGLLNRDQLQAAQEWAKLKDMEAGTTEFDAQRKIFDDAFNKAEAWWRSESKLIDPITLNYIDGSVEGDAPAGAITLTKEEQEEIEKQLAKSDDSIIEEEYYLNGQQKWNSDEIGKNEKTNITINSQKAAKRLADNNIFPTGINDNGYEYTDVPTSILSAYYDEIVESESNIGWTFEANNWWKDFEKKYGEGAYGAGKEDNVSWDNKFKSPIGHFGLTLGEDGKPMQTFEDLEYGFGSMRREGEYAGRGDLSKAFKRHLKDYRDDRNDIIKRGKVLGKMHLLNIDPAKTKTFLPERGVELITEGLATDLLQLPDRLTPDIVSSRETKDVMEEIVRSTPIREGKKMAEGWDRSGAFRIYEGVSGFVPALAEFALIDVALKKTGAITGIPRLLRAGRGVFKNSKGVRYTAEEIAAFEAKSGYAAGTKKFKSYIRSIGGSATHNMWGQLAHHTYMGVREEAKMRVAFDEHYHMGGGVGFYGVGALMNNLGAPKLNLLNTLTRFGKSGVAGATSTVAAQNLEAMIRDLKGNETYQTFLKDTYGDVFKGHDDMYDYTDFLTDFAVFGIVGAKQFFKSKGTKYAFYHQGALNKKYKTITAEYDALKEKVKTQAEGGILNEQAYEQLEKKQEVLDMIETQMNQVNNYFIESDPVLAKKSVERSAENIKKVLEPYAPEGIEINVVKGKDSFVDKNAAAEYVPATKDKKHTINIDLNDYKHGKLPQEVFHMSLNILFKKNPQVRSLFKNALIESFGKEKFFQSKTGKEMTIEEMLKAEYGEKSENIKTEEFSAWVTELLADPLNYSRFVGNGVFKSMANNINRYTNKHIGKSVFTNKDSKQDIINFIGNFAKSVAEGKLTDKQFNMLRKIGEGNLFAFESVEADMRTPERKNREEAEKQTEEVFKSADVRELSRKTQEAYDANIKGKKGEEYNTGVENLIKRDLSNPESVAGKNFDKLIYKIITDRAPNYGLADINTPNRLGEKMMLAFEMVEHTGRGSKAKNRGLKGILEEYKNFPEFKDKKSGKFVIFDKEGNKKLSETKIIELEEAYKAERGTKEFREQAVEEGYKGKQNLTKTVDQMLRERFDEFMESTGLKKETGFEEYQEGIYKEEIGAIEDRGSYVKELTVKAFEVELGGKGEINTESKVEISKLKRTNGETVIQPKDLIEQNKLADKFITEIERSVDFRYQAITNKLSKQESFVKASERAVGLDFYDKSKYPDLKPSERYEKMAAEIKNISKEAYEVMKKTHDDATSETTLVLKTFPWMYKKTGEYFKFAELKGVPDVLKLDKAKGIEKWEKVEQSESGLDMANWVLEGSRKDTHKKRAKKLAEALADVFAVKAVDRAFNVESISKLGEFKDIKAESGFVKEGFTAEFQGLKFEAAIKSVKSLIRGAMPESLASARVEQYKRDFVRAVNNKISPEKALDYVINKYDLGKDVKINVLKDLMLGKARERGVEDIMIEAIEAKEALGVETGEKVLIFKDFKEIGKSVKKDLPKEVAELVNFEKSFAERTRDPKFTREFVEDFIAKELYPELGVDVINKLFNMERTGEKALFITMGGGQYKFGYLDGVRPTVEYGKILSQTISPKKGIKLPNGASVKDIKINDNTKVQKIVDQNLVKLENGQLKNTEAYRKQVMMELSPDGTVKGYFRMIKANEGLLQLMTSKMKSHYDKALKTNNAIEIAKAIDNIMYLSQMQTNLGAGIFRGGATHTAVTLQRPKEGGKLSDRYRSEHELQMMNFSGNLISNIINTRNAKQFNSRFKGFIDNFKQSIISRDLQKIIDSVEKGGNTFSPYAIEKMNLNAEAKLTFLVNREVMENTLDLRTGKTYAEIVDTYLGINKAMKVIEAAETKSVNATTKKAGLPKNVSFASKKANIKNRDRALELGRKRDKKSRGMSTFDFDDTLATTKSGVRYEMPNPSGKPAPQRKAILLVGAAGAGKTTVIDQLGLRKQGFKYVNQDVALDWLSRNSGLPKNMNEFTREQSNKWRDLQYDAAYAAKDKASKLRGKGDGVIIDSTGGNIRSISRDFKDAGYDVQVIHVNSSLETALARNRSRTERRLTDTTVKNSYEKVQKSIKGIKELVDFFPKSVKEFVEINTDNIKQGDALPADFVKKINNFTSGYIKGRINAEQFALEGSKLLEQGAKYDFSEFNKVVEGAPGPLLKTALERAKKFGTDNMFVLTARPAASAGPIREFLKSQGLDIPLENITGLGNSTGEAKAMWMLEKFAEGYNDMYFVDDAMPNVKAVKNVLNQLDIKSDVQQALSSKNVNLNNRVNKVMEHSLDIKSEKRFSKAEAKVRGKDIKRRRFFFSDSAADLELLIEPLYGKGKKGIENKEWFKKEFVQPFERGIRDYNTAKQSTKSDYMALRKKNKDVVKDLPKQVEGTNFTNDMAIRVYLWNKAGHAIPDLAPTTQKKLVNHVINNPKLLGYAESFAKLTKVEGGLKEPTGEWWAETLAGEIINMERGVPRKKYLQDWIDRKNEIFSEENLNKMESKLGTRWRENIEDMFDRMETGRTRGLKLDRGSAAMMNYLNGSVGTIMNFNTRSAALQTISTINFLNMRENNPIAAARAMGNVKQFSKDFMRIMNSDMLKQRRDGLQINVTEAELASAAAESKNPIRSMTAKILKAGYLPTKLADSFAISFGGATFYRNRIKMYEKQGLSTKEAEAKAWIDFQALSERTQQSSRPDLLSKQQTSFAGRLILPFANTPMQMNRRGAKDIFDLAKGRYKNKAEAAEKMGRITYYMGAQVAIFAGLQSALFGMLMNDEDVSSEKIEKTKEYTLNTISDSFLRGLGIQGAILSGLKNAVMSFHQQEEKGFSADYSEIGEALLNISPPVGSKFGKLDQAGNTRKWAKSRGEDEFKFELGNPSLESSLLTIEALSNLPVHRVHKKTNNIIHSLNSDYENWQRAHMIGGWTPWSVGIESESKKKKKKKKSEFELPSSAY